MSLKQKGKMSLFMACTMIVSLVPNSLSVSAATDDKLIYENNFEKGKGPDEVAGVITKEDVSVVSLVKGNNALKFKSKFDGSDNWETNKHELAFYKEYSKKISKDSTLQFDILVPTDEKVYDGQIKYIGGLGTHDKSTDKWGWVGTSYGDINSSDFVDLGNGYSSKSVTVKLNDNINVDLFKVDLQIVSYNCNYNGDIYLDNIKLISSNLPEKVEVPAVVDDFEGYGGEDKLLEKEWKTNAGDGCSVIPKLVKDGTGNHDLEFNYKISTEKVTEGWAGITKDKKVDWSSFNSLQFWCTPDGKGQKLAIQITSNGEDFEVNMPEFASTTSESLITIPFSKFKGKKGGTLDLSKIERIGIWCNTIPKNSEGHWTVDSKMYFDDIKAVYVVSDEEKEKLIQDSTDLIRVAVSNKNQEDLDKAQEMIKKIPGCSEKDALQNRLDTVKDRLKQNNIRKLLFKLINM
ncbi:carbohydrate binding domain-containing protein [Clostridium sp. HBUAS56017]|uniref:carbohydrate binding domain-containing protein n=1 Tax=Clostridium sp. HBUAS56017 TaxID=2571128 RepID=UPI001177EA00|nr:carbohydrate binding domain-containing protein [Clostridium sp. HBUAS56017]